jgi:selenide,water dikinase
LIGHLVEMLRAANVGASLDLSAVPFLDGAQSLAAEGIRSSLLRNNLRVASAIANAESYANHDNYELCFDPQTSGGLLAAVPAENANECLEKLRALGYVRSCMIGSVTSAPSHPTESILTLR